ncbi:hypothetical protein HY59_08150 [Raoultella ornithinolytica]|nr:hypothetical protein HY59_08150 [Raoultella ornithinolytica]
MLLLIQPVKPDLFKHTASSVINGGMKCIDTLDDLVCSIADNGPFNCLGVAMGDWLYDLFSKVIQHYKEMTAIGLLIAFMKISFPILMSWLNRRLDRAEHRKRVKLWTDIGCSEEEAEDIIRKFEDDVRKELKRTSLLSRIKYIIRKKTR